MACIKRVNQINVKEDPNNPFSMNVFINVTDYQDNTLQKKIPFKGG